MVIPLPLPLGQVAAPFDDPAWLFELKYDGFRALAVIEHGSCRFLSRNRHPLGGFTGLADAIVQETKADEAILDGELAITDETGRSVFASMMTGHRGKARYFAFDLLSLDGKDLRALPLVKRKERLKQIMPARSAHILYVDHVRGTGTALFRAAQELDLEGIIAKSTDSRYVLNSIHRG
jgi:bifunctional non-homologous end joining protein LigD